MKIALFGISEIKLGKHNLKDPRLDQADKLAEADKKTHAQADVIGEDLLLEADGILALHENKADLILKDLEFVETRLGRDPQPAERAALEKIQTLLESERFLFSSGLSAEDLQAVAAHSFYTNKPITVAAREELQNPDALLLRAFADAGYLSFLTVGGKENRAWPIRKGTTAWEAAGTIHTDIQKGFIRAEITSFADFVEAGGAKGPRGALGLVIARAHGFHGEETGNADGNDRRLDPPANMICASFILMVRQASPMAWLAVAQAEQVAKLGPRRLKYMDTKPEAMLPISMGMVKGETRPGPRESRMLTVRWWWPGRQCPSPE